MDHAGPGHQRAGGRCCGYQGRRPPWRGEKFSQVYLRNVILYNHLQTWLYKLDYSLRAGFQVSEPVFRFLKHLISLDDKCDVHRWNWLCVCVVFPEFVRGRHRVHSPRDRRRLPLPVSPSLPEDRETCNVTLLKHTQRTLDFSEYNWLNLLILTINNNTPNQVKGQDHSWCHTYFCLPCSLMHRSVRGAKVLPLSWPLTFEAVWLFL